MRVTRAVRRGARAALFATALLGAAKSAGAHFPIVRAATFSRGSAVAAALPGFGIVMRRSASEPFSYVCNALIGAPPSDEAPKMAFTGDGALLVGTSTGMKSVTAGGCPRAEVAAPLGSEPVGAIAVKMGAENIVYATVGGAAPRLAKSTDGGQSWALLAPLLANEPVTALVLDDAAPDHVYVSQASPDGGSTLEVSVDGGATFTAFAQQNALALQAIEHPSSSDAGSTRYWALGHDLAQPRAFDLFSATSPDGPWAFAFTVNYFGGFTLDDVGGLWLANESGGLFRSTDGGETFDDVAPQIGAACLEFAQGALYACTPGLPEQSAVVRWSDAQRTFDDVVTLANVTHLPECGAQVDVSQICAAAWVEWQRDVILGGMPGGMTPTDAGSPQAAPDGTPGAALAKPEAAGGCSLPHGVTALDPSSAPRSRHHGALAVALFGAALRRTRRDRRARRMP